MQCWWSVDRAGNLSAGNADRRQVKIIFAHNRTNAGSPERKTRCHPTALTVKTIYQFKAFDVIRKPRCGKICILKMRIVIFDKNIHLLSHYVKINLEDGSFH